MNRFYDEIADIFKNAGIENFEKLPEEKSEKRKFAKLFKQFNQRLEAAQIQGFSWSKDTYTVVDPDESESYIVMHFDYNIYLALLQRYKELPSGGGGGTGEEPPFEIDTHITEINTDAIDADYMNSRFDKFFRLLQQGNVDWETLDQVLKDLHKSYSMLPREQQRYANLFISDVQSGEITVDPTMTFRDYIAK
jgi:type I restriction enzyme R subunit